MTNPNPLITPGTEARPVCPHARLHRNLASRSCSPMDRYPPALTPAMSHPHVTGHLTGQPCPSLHCRICPYYDQGGAGWAVFLGFDYPDRDHRVQGGPAGPSHASRLRRPWTTLDSASAPLGSAPMRRTGQNRRPGDGSSNRVNPLGDGSEGVANGQTCGGDRRRRPDRNDAGG